MTGHCLEVHDLAVSKLVAGRNRVLAFISGLLRHGLADPDSIRDRLSQTPLDDARRQLCRSRLQRLFAGSVDSGLLHRIESCARITVAWPRPLYT